MGKTHKNIQIKKILSMQHALNPLFFFSYKFINIPIFYVCNSLSNMFWIQTRVPRLGMRAMRTLFGLISRETTRTS